MVYFVIKTRTMARIPRTPLGSKNTPPKKGSKLCCQYSVSIFGWKESILHTFDFQVFSQPCANFRPVVDVWERGSLTFKGDWPTTSYFILTLRYE